MLLIESKEEWYRYITYNDLYLNDEPFTLNKFMYIFSNKDDVYLQNIVNQVFNLKTNNIPINVNKDLYYDLFIYLLTIDHKEILLYRYIRKLFKKERDKYDNNSYSSGEYLARIITNKVDMKVEIITLSKKDMKYIRIIPFYLYILRGIQYTSLDLLQFKSILPILSIEPTIKNIPRILKKMYIYVMDDLDDNMEQYKDLVCNLELYYLYMSTTSTSITDDRIETTSSYDLFINYGLKRCIYRIDLVRICKKLQNVVISPFSLNTYDKDIIYRKKEYTFKEIRQKVKTKDKPILKDIMAVIKEEWYFFQP